ncbi:MAG: hypothetical protein KGJ72_05960, partial [Gammaproteobacteria bacterium]|nr:hypothetical protein [Gammaproteobacteria bacterium]
MRLTWMMPWRGLAVSLAWRYFSAVDPRIPELQQKPVGWGSVAAGTISNTDAHLPSMSHMDLTASAELRDNLCLRVGVNSVTDKDAPLIGLTDLPDISGN